MYHESLYAQLNNVIMIFYLKSNYINIMNIYYVTPYLWLGKNIAACFVLREVFHGRIKFPKGYL